MVNELGGSEIDGATVLGIAPDRDVWSVAQYPFVPSPAQPSQTAPDPGRAARFDGKEWTIVEMPDDLWIGPTLAPDGTLWAYTRRGPARYDGQRWAFPYVAISSP